MVTIPKTEHVLLIKASRDFLACKDELAIANLQIVNLQSQIEDYEQKEVNWGILETSWNAREAGYKDELAYLKSTINQQKKELVKSKITAWTAPIGVTLVATAIIIPIALSK